MAEQPAVRPFGAWVDKSAATGGALWAPLFCDPKLKHRRLNRCRLNQVDAEER